MAADVLHKMVEMHEQGKPFAVATVIETTGSVSAKTGAKAVVDGSGRVVAGWVGGGCAESTTRSTALDCLESGVARVIEIDMDDEILGVGMPCGGHMRVYVEPNLPRPGLWVMGHGRVAECVALFGDAVGLEVIINDPAADPVDYPEGARVIQDDLDYGQLQPKAQDYVVIATQHKGDHESMQQALRSPARYVALIASRKRAGLVMDYLRDAGFGQADLGRVVTPAGLDLGARTPEEIAQCVVSEIVMRRRGASGAPMCLDPAQSPPKLVGA